jgi:hypothetical protein
MIVRCDCESIACACIILLCLHLLRLSRGSLASQGFLDAVAYGLAPAIVVRWKLVLMSLYAYFVTGKFVMLTDETKHKAGGAGDEVLPPLFKQYREHSDVDIEMIDSQHSPAGSEVDDHHGHAHTHEDHEDHDFEEKLKMYDVFTDTDSGAGTGAGSEGGTDSNLSQPGAGVVDSRTQTFSATGLTNFYGEDFDY